MTTLDEITAQRDAAIAILDDQIVAANRFGNEGAAGMDERINALEDQKEKIAAQAYAAARTAPAMADALAKLRAVTNEMNQVAGNMRTATTFIGNLNGLIATSNKVIPALKGISGGPPPSTA
jgi:hypothetical protein